LKIVILTEFGKGIGLGHITRMGALSDYLNETGDKCELIAYEKGSESSNWLRSEVYMHHILNVDAVIIDSYLCDYQIYSEISKEVPILMAIDDINRIQYPKSVIINPNVYYSSIDYSNQTAKHFGGIDYVILRRPFSDDPTISQIDQQILITLGGSDYRKLLPILARLSGSFSNIHFIVPDLDEFNALLSDFPKLKIFGKLSEWEFYRELSEAEIVISACGQTLHECYRLEKNTIGICIDHDQILNRNYYESVGFLFNSYDWNEKSLLEGIEKDITSLIREKKSIDNKTRTKLNPKRNLENIKAKLVAG
jgi:UDP-2,4-diacetamido-2,4,6-trideoxy-beta-L-altropyranose hydrolase